MRCHCPLPMPLPRFFGNVLQKGRRWGNIPEETRKGTREGTAAETTFPRPPSAPPPLWTRGGRTWRVTTPWWGFPLLMPKRPRVRWKRRHPLRRPFRPCRSPPNRPNPMWCTCTNGHRSIGVLPSRVVTVRSLPVLPFFRRLLPPHACRPPPPPRWTNVKMASIIVGFRALFQRDVRAFLLVW